MFGWLARVLIFDQHATVYAFGRYASSYQPAHETLSFVAIKGNAYSFDDCAERQVPHKCFQPAQQPVNCKSKSDPSKRTLIIVLKSRTFRAQPSNIPVSPAHSFAFDRADVAHDTNWRKFIQLPSISYPYNAHRSVCHVCFPKASSEPNWQSAHNKQTTTHYERGPTTHSPHPVTATNALLEPFWNGWPELVNCFHREMRSVYQLQVGAMCAAKARQ